MAERLENAMADRLTCVECAARSDPVAARWRAYLSSDDEIVIFCPACAEREFDDRTGAAGESG